MSQLLIRNGRIIDPAQKLDGPGSLLTSGGRIVWLSLGSTVPPPPDCQILDAAGMVACPGFIDLHCHLRQPGFEEKETITTGTQAAARGGFTTVCGMPNTSPPLDNAEMINYVKSTALSDGAIRVLPIGCISKGRRGESLAPLEEMASAGAVGFSDDGSPVMDSRLMQQAMERAGSLGLPVISHCEDLTLTAGGVMNEGEVSARLGLKGMPAAAEETMVARDIALAELTGAHVHIAHVSTAGSVELVRRAREKGLHVTAEVTPHHLTLTEEMVIKCGTSAKVNPPLRTKRDVEALIRGLREGVIDAVATDHAPHTRADKGTDFARAAFGISGLETALGSLMALVHRGELSLPVLIERLTTGPARVLGSRYRLGTLAIGAPADIIILDPDREWVVDPADLASKGKNTPLVGLSLKGRVMATIYQGKLVYKDSSVRLGGPVEIPPSFQGRGIKRESR